MRNDKAFIPKKYGMILCSHCDGLGKLFRNGREIQVCPVCGGFGAIKNPKRKVIQTHGMTERWKNGILD